MQMSPHSERCELCSMEAEHGKVLCQSCWEMIARLADFFVPPKHPKPADHSSDNTSREHHRASGA